MPLAFPLDILLPSDVYCFLDLVADLVGICTLALHNPEETEKILPRRL